MRRIFLAAALLFLTLLATVPGRVRAAVRELTDEECARLQGGLRASAFSAVLDNFLSGRGNGIRKSDEDRYEITSVPVRTPDSPAARALAADKRMGGGAMFAFPETILKDVLTSPSPSFWQEYEEYWNLILPDRLLLPDPLDPLDPVAIASLPKLDAERLARRFDAMEAACRDRGTEPLSLLPKIEWSYQPAWMQRFLLRTAPVTPEIERVILDLPSAAWLGAMVVEQKATAWIPLLGKLLDSNNSENRESAATALIALDAGVPWAVKISGAIRYVEQNQWEWILEHLPAEDLETVLTSLNFDRTLPDARLLRKRLGVIPAARIREQLQRKRNRGWMLAAAAAGETEFLAKLQNVDQYVEPFRRHLLIRTDWWKAEADGPVDADRFLQKHRYLTVESLVHIPDTSDLSPMLKSGNRELVTGALVRIQSEGQKGTAELMPDLLRLMHSAESALANMAAAALGKTATAEAVAELMTKWDAAREAAVEHGVEDKAAWLGRDIQVRGKNPSGDDLVFLRKCALDRDLPGFVRLAALFALPISADDAVWTDGDPACLEELAAAASCMRDYPAYYAETNSFTDRVRLELLDILSADADTNISWTWLGSRMLENFLAEHAARLLTICDRGSDDEFKLQVLKAAGTHGSAKLAPAVADSLHAANPTLRQAACEALRKTGGKEQLPMITKLLDDPEGAVRQAALRTLVSLGAGDPGVKPLLAAFLTQPQRLVGLHQALSLLPGKLPDATTPSILEYHFREGTWARETMLCCVLNGSPDWAAAAAPFLVEASAPGLEALPEIRAVVNPVLALHAESAAGAYPLTSAWSANLAIDLVKPGRWSLTDLPWLERLETETAADADNNRRAAIQRILATVRETDPWWHVWRAVRKAPLVLAGLAALWLPVLTLYRWWPAARACVWLPAVRQIAGLGKVGPLLAAVPALRRWLLVPCRPEDLAPDTAELDEWTFFDGLKLRKTNGEDDPVPALPALRETPGLQVVEAVSGQGKTTLLQALAAAADAVPCVFLRAAECPDGLLPEVQRRLPPGMRGDRDFLAVLLRRDSLRLLIDGFQEAGDDTRRRILRDIADLSGARIILTTQPLSQGWPESAVRWTVEPMQLAEGGAFLRRQGAALLPPGDAEKATAFSVRITTWLESLAALPPGAPAADAALAMLGNPMEATLAAELFAEGTVPIPGTLMAQKIAIMEAGFVGATGHAFPSGPLAERLLAWRRSGQAEPDLTGLPDAVAALQSHRLLREVIPAPDSQARLRFRHDRVVDCLLLPAFTGAGAVRQHEHAGDIRFRGVYRELARALPPAAANELAAWLWKRDAVEPDGLAAWFQKTQAATAGGTTD